MTITFSKKEAVAAGWKHFKKRPLFIIGLFIITVLISVFTGAIVDALPKGIVGFVANVLDYSIQIVVSMGMTLILFHLYDEVETGYRDLLTPMRLFWSYLGASILMSICIVLGFILFIIPGIILSIALMFVGYLIIDRELGPIEALKESMRLTKGHRWNLLLFLLLLLILNIAGAMCFGVGLFITIPVSALATVHVYRWLLTPRTDEGVEISFLSKALSALAILVIVGGGVVLLGTILNSARFSNTDTPIARDAQRQADIVTIREAANRYFSDNNTFPQISATLVPEYISSLPLDPSTYQPYSYTVFEEGLSIEVCTTLEIDTSGGIHCELSKPFGDTPLDTSTDSNSEEWTL